MRSTIDSAGRVVVPKAMRDRLGLVGGSELDIIEVDGVIEMKPSPIAARKVVTDEGAVIAADGDVSPMTDDDVRRALERTRR
ncbi:MAG: AbrB/MazE/SpoVT family DNA-binding domain-containing protein [Acidimicrobiia bacterium]